MQVTRTESYARTSVEVADDWPIGLGGGARLERHYVRLVSEPQSTDAPFEPFGVQQSGARVDVGDDLATVVGPRLDRKDAIEILGTSGRDPHLVRSPMGGVELERLDVFLCEHH